MSHGYSPQAWKGRPRSPGLRWYKDYNSPESLKNGRVLVVDYVKKDHSKEGMRKVTAQEISSVDGLRKLYASPDRCEEAVLRVIHCQNADWATGFLLHKFNINARDDLVGTDFGKYVKYKRPERRGGKPFLSGKSWKTIHDPWRGISRTSFGLDYLKQYQCPKIGTKPEKLDVNEKMMELNCYDEDDNPAYGFDVYVQRLVSHSVCFYGEDADMRCRAATYSIKSLPRTYQPTCIQIFKIPTKRVHTGLVSTSMSQT